MSTKRLVSRISLLRISAVASAACATILTPITVAMALPSAEYALQQTFIGIFPESVWNAFMNVLPFMTLALFVWAMLATWIAKNTLEKVHELEYEIDHLHKIARNMARQSMAYPQTPIGQRGVRPMQQTATSEFATRGPMPQTCSSSTVAATASSQIPSAEPVVKAGAHSMAASSASVTGRMQPVSSAWMPTDGGVNWTRMVDEIEDELGVVDEHRTFRRAPAAPEKTDYRSEIPALYEKDQSEVPLSVLAQARRSGKVVDIKDAREAMLSATAPMRTVGRHFATAQFAAVPETPVEGEALLPAVAGQEPGWHRAPVNPASVIDQMLAELEG